MEKESIDLIYLDPPFFKNKKFTGISSSDLRKYSFDDFWKGSDDYAKFLFDRISLCKGLLKKTGSIFVHCDTSAVHIIRNIMNIIFGEDNFRSEIIWYYKRWSNAKKGLLNSHQNIMFFSKTKDFKWNQALVDYSETTNLDQIMQRRKRNSLGKTEYEKDLSGEIVIGGVKKGVPLGDVWEIPFLNPKAKERTGYPTQKPILLLDKIIQLTTDEGDVVLDPFCGSGTTLVSAKLLNRKYIGIDESGDAISLSKERLDSPIKTESHLMKKGKDHYRPKDEFVDNILRDINCSRVNRNKGIDALLKDEVMGKPAFIKVQRENESLEYTYGLMLSALENKKGSLGIIIQTDDSKIDINLDSQIVSVCRTIHSQIKMKFNS
ncbi:DNA-methyltransferase [Rosenbergiella epipactidis]|uniref:DNA-methyltransferase n=1 Tax=Rosenbergiella epipactidis TaxID=1544694 RepID=UPI001F4DA4B5|nr:DNA methyltransferase [Rosenbergiella epipactidis]